MILYDHTVQHVITHTHHSHDNKNANATRTQRQQLLYNILQDHPVLIIYGRPME